MKNEFSDKLINILHKDFEDILTILKALSNENRLKVLISLINNERSFNDLKDITKLKKTALSNHLNDLLDINLVDRPDHGIYSITNDGLDFLRALSSAFKFSDIKMRKEIDEVQQRKMSQEFRKKILHRG
ncbi:MAG: ArsR family transcriptional regulator [Candidatus Lokiarchaeota archaeon]|nr:ArsR family transcriptional regulator [Candidatus Lokiarchaeota archaeon]MBD3201563.1 ArsR family transcriptional regulator [Candidatus Lokiarchaeota archaeon]